MSPQRRRRILILAAILIAAWIAVRVIPSLANGWQEARWGLRDRARLLAQSRREIANEKITFDSAARIKEGMVALAPRLLTGETAAQASDALTGLIGVVAARTNTKVTGTNPVEDSATAGDLHRVAVHAAIDGDIRGVTDLLRGLALEVTVLTTDGLQILASETAGNVSETEVLRVEVTVRGWYQATRQRNP